ncbi:MAG: hypothetical protein IKH04_05640 [Kiritimatiellae bacterium]|nr:hypothetical protein [Kiritimatiellia bacterium]
MTPIGELTRYITDKTHFASLSDFAQFAIAYLDFVEQGLQARIVCQNETNYQFFQYREDCAYNISRPVNMDIFGESRTFKKTISDFLNVLKTIKAGKRPKDEMRLAFTSAIYTFQQSIGAALDALPASQANQAKKINGDLFERLIRLVFSAAGLECSTGIIPVPVKDDNGNELFKMNYQHDLIVRSAGEIKLLGSIKTSSKDRIDKVFVDKLLFSRLSGQSLPYIAIFLNDVQRSKSKTLNSHRINSTFLSGHFKAYSIRLAPLDGVFYCDLRPNMKADPFLAQRIKGIDELFFGELPRLGLAPLSKRVPTNDRA